MAWWRERVVAPARRAWLAVARRARSGRGSTGAVDLRRDVQTCGYDDVRVMWNMLSSDQQAYGFRPPAPGFLLEAVVWAPPDAAAQCGGGVVTDGCGFYFGMGSRDVRVI